MNRPRVLIVDDSQAMAEMIEQVLGQRFEIVGVGFDGDAAFDATRWLEPDVLVLDIFMPGIGGIEAARAILDLPRPPAIVFATMCEKLETVRAALQTGALGYVLKPSLISELVPAVELATHGRRFISSRLIAPYRNAYADSSVTSSLEKSCSER